MPGRYTLTYNDHGGEISSVGVHVDTPVEAEYDDWNAELVVLRDAIEAVQLSAVRRKETRSNSVIKGSIQKAADPNCQRENKWLVKAQDNTFGQAVDFEIPCADLTFLQTGEEYMDLTSTEGAALVAAIEATVRSLVGSNVTVIRIDYVGRDL